MTRRLILIGGAAGTGKSTLARELARQLDAHWLQLDTVWIALRDAARPAERAVLDIDSRVRAHAEPAAALLQHHLGAAEAVCAALPYALSFELQTHDVVADGAWLLPRFMASLQIPDVEIVPVLLVEDDPAQVQERLTSRRGQAQVADWHEDSARLAWEYGGWLAGAAHAEGVLVLPCRPFATLTDRVLAAVG